MIVLMMLLVKISVGSAAEEERLATSDVSSSGGNLNVYSNDIVSAALTKNDGRAGWPLRRLSVAL